MNENQTPLAPQQKRSRETLQRLLGAALKTLDEGGLAGATVPRIASAAGVAPANIYRRFEDKDALLRATFLHLLKLANEGNRNHLAEMVMGKNLHETATRLIRTLMQPYREHPALLRSLIHFLSHDTDEGFLNQARALVLDNLNIVASVLLSHQSEIMRPNPEKAARFAVLSALSSIEAICMDPRALWHDSQQMTDEELMAELTLACVAYLRTT